MSKRTRNDDSTPLGKLKKTITETSTRASSPTIAVDRIFFSVSPVPSKDTSLLIFTNDEYKLWPALKQDIDFWYDIIENLGLPDLDPTFNASLQLSNFSTVMTEPWMKEVIEKKQLANVDDTLLHRSLFDAFLCYMKWYDKDASVSFLILYAYYLKHSEPSLLVSFSTTPCHAEVREPQPIFTEPPIVTNTTSTTSTTSTTTTVSTSSPTNPLKIVTVDKLDIISTLDYQTTTNWFKYTFSMEKGIKPRVFRIRSEEKLYEVKTNGVIERILKFVYQGMIIVVISGPVDKKLIRFWYDFDPRAVIVVDNFSLSGEYDDLTYAHQLRPSRYATNQKSVSTFALLNLIDLKLLANIIPCDNITKDEKLRRAAIFKELHENTQGDNRALTEQEKKALIFWRTSKGITEALPKDMTLAQLNVSDPIYGYEAFLAVQQALLSIPTVCLQDKEEHKRVVEPIILEGLDDNEKILYRRVPFLPKYKTAREAHPLGSEEAIGIRVVRMPGETQEDVFHLAVLSKFYTEEDEKTHTLRIRFFLYRKHKDKGLFVDSGSYMKDRDIILLDNHIITAPIKDFTIVFHSESWCHVEITELTINNEIVFHNSQMVYIDRNYPGFLPRRVFAPLTSIKDGAFFLLMATNGYKMYDFRPDPSTEPNRLGEFRFDCIFVKYVSISARPYGIQILAYKSDAEGGQPLIAFKKLKWEKPPISMISPMHLQDNLFYIVPSGATHEVLNVKFDEQRRFTVYPENFNLSSRRTPLSDNTVEYDIATSLQRSLRLSNKDEPHCVLCGEYANNRDELSNKVYCDELCQFVFCQTHPL